VIEATPVKTPDDLIRNLPGMNLSRGQSTVTHPTGQSIGMRGIGSNRALILVDGVPLNDAFGGWVNWSKVALPNVEQIELVKGGGSNLYGSYAMGGVINILTRVPDHDAARLEAGYGSFDTYRLNLYGAKVFEGAASRIAFRLLNVDPAGER
jgi:iron complex outermembrane receptor protein